MSNEFLDYIEDIIDAMEKAEVLLDGVSFDQFDDDFRINFAVVRALEIIGEATKRIPGKVRDEYTSIPWKDMAGMRDRIIHGYDNVDLRIVWDTVKKRLPDIKPQLEQIVEDFKDVDEASI